MPTENKKPNMYEALAALQTARAEAQAALMRAQVATAKYERAYEAENAARRDLLKAIDSEGEKYSWDLQAAKNELESFKKTLEPAPEQPSPAAEMPQVAADAPVATDDKPF